MKNDLDPAMIAKDFAKRIAAYLDDEEIGGTPERIDELNQIEDFGAPLVCHSHDFCDANVFMMEAIENATGEGFDFHDPETSELFNAAWKIAMATGFATLAAS